jgi:hypothetical protein
VIHYKIEGQRASDSHKGTSYIVKAMEAGFIPNPGEEVMQLMAGYAPKRMTVRQCLEAFPGKQLRRV